MKTFKLNSLFALFCAAGLLLSCSDDDIDDLVNEPTQTPRVLNEPVSEEPASLDLVFSVNLNALSQDRGCGAGNYLFQHSGTGSSSVIGDYTVDISYCGVPEANSISSVEVVVEDTGGNKIFLQQRPENTAGGDQNNFTNISSGETPGLYSGNGVPNDDNELLVLEVTGGTGIYSSAQGTFTSRLSPGFQAGAEMSNFSLSGILSGI